MAKNILPESFKKAFYEAIIEAKIHELPTLEERRVALGRLAAEFKKSHKAESFAQPADDSGEDTQGSITLEGEAWEQVVTDLANKSDKG